MLILKKCVFFLKKSCFSCLVRLPGLWQGSVSTKDMREPLEKVFRESRKFPEKNSKSSHCSLHCSLHCILHCILHGILQCSLHCRRLHVFPRGSSAGPAAMACPPAQSAPIDVRLLHVFLRACNCSASISTFFHVIA